MTAAPTHGLRRERLSNGVTLLVQRRATAPAVAVVSHLRAGFLDEPDAVAGISHVLEHMLFKGTPSLGPGELAQRIKAIGGALNAYTSYDRTVYFASTPARNLRELVALQADQVQRPLLDADELRRELGVIIQEARRKLDTPGAVAGERLHELLFSTHRIRRWRIGAEAVLEQFTRDDVAGYYESRYVPDRAIISLVGDVDSDEAIDVLREQWSTWSRPAVPIPPGPVERSAPHLAVLGLDGDVVLSELALGWRAPGVLDPDIPALDMAAAMLTLGRGARLSRALRETGRVNAIGAGSYGVVDAGVFSIGAELEAGQIEPVVRIIADALGDLAAHAASPSEFARARAMLRARVARRLERYEGRAIALADAESFGDVTRLDREDADLLAVTPARVRDVVAQWLVPDRMSAVAYLPRNSPVHFDADLLRRAIAGRGDVAASAVSLPPGDPPLPITARPSGSHRLAPAPRLVHHLAVADADILTARLGDTGQASLHVYRRRDRLESPEDAGIAALVMRAMVRGTGRLDSVALAFAFESMGGSLAASVGTDVLGLSATVQGEYVPDAMALLAEVMRQPRFDPATVAIEQALLLADARAVTDDMMRFPIQLALGVAFNHIGYGAPALGTPESISSFTTDRVRQWHAQMLTGSRTTIVAVGEDDPQRLADEIAAAIGSRDALATAPQRARAGAASEVIRPGQQAETRDRKQSALAMLFPGPSRTDPARFAAETWSAIAGGLGGRLFESLRSARSLAYTVIANSWQRRRAGGLLTYIATDPARLAEARDAMLEELDRFRQAPPTPIELSRATAMLAGHAEMGRQTAGALASEIADAWLLGEGLSELDDPAAPYRAVTAAEVHAVAQGLQRDVRAEGVVAARIE